MSIQKKKQPKIIKPHREKQVDKGVSTQKYCGVLKLKEDPLVIQKKLRNEWR